MPTPTNPAAFTGDFELIPVRAHLDHGPVPSMVRMHDFTGVMTHVLLADPWTMEGAATFWHGEAIRWRSGNPRVPLDLKVIATNCAERLHAAQAKDLDRE